MNIDWWILVVNVVVWLGIIATIFVYRHRVKQKVAELEIKEREQKIEEELEMARKEDAKREHQKKLDTVNYWLNKIGQCYFQHHLTDVIVKEIFDEDPFSETSYYSSPFGYSVIPKAYNYRDEAYKVFIPFKAIDGWIYAMTVKMDWIDVDDEPTEEVYIVELKILGDEQTNPRIGPPANLPTLKYPRFMIDGVTNNLRLKDNFEYFVPYDFDICEDIENPWKPTIEEGIDIDSIVKKMGESIEIFGKSLRGENE